MALNQIRKRKISLPSTSGDSASSSSTPQWKYDAFLNFRGEDTRKTFVDHLYFYLQQKGIDVFKDDAELDAGQKISPALCEAIETSRLAIAIFSENYASSKWCLEELVKILECKKHKGQKVIPIFYHVEPTEVRHQTGNFAAAFANHEIVNSEKVQIWREALKAAADSVGFDTQITANGYESQCIQIIVGKILKNLGCKVFCIDKSLVGMESRVNEVISMLDIASDSVLRIGIWGMGGIGKTTLAKVVFGKIRDKFEGSSYLENVGQYQKTHGLEHLQDKLFYDLGMNISTFYGRINIGIHMLRRKKVLLVLDDVDNEDQIDRLVGNDDWLLSGSRIIITTRDKRVLSVLEEDRKYEVKLLTHHEAIQLFSTKAFKSDHPNKGYEELSLRVIDYAGLLPLALTILGCSFYGRDMAQWGCAVERLKLILGKEKNILKTLEISYEGLDPPERDIFLDIACFLRGRQKDDVIRILNSFEFPAVIGISILVEKSLITYSLDGTIQMHDLIQEMGQHIASKDYPQEPRRRKRLWRREDVCYVLTKNKGSRAIEGIKLDLPDPVFINVNPNAFKKMDNLRLLTVNNAYLSQGLEYLPNNLRVLNWNGYPSKPLPESFEPKKLVELQMPYSNIIHPWKGKKQLPNLKVMNFSHCQKLTTTPDFTRIPKLEELILRGCSSLVEPHPSVNQLHNLKFMNFSCTKLTTTPDFRGIPKLERLVLRGCTNLVELHPSVNILKKLKFLDLGYCNSLTSLPSSIQLESLEFLDLAHCYELQKFPEMVGNMERLLCLFLYDTAIKELPSSIEHLNGLVIMDLRWCKNLTSLPSGICKLKSLALLNVCGCSKLDKLPENIGGTEYSKHLLERGIALKNLPSTIDKITRILLIRSWRLQEFNAYF